MDFKAAKMDYAEIDFSDIRTLALSYACCILLQTLTYFGTRVLSLDPNAHPPEDQMEKKTPKKGEFNYNERIARNSEENMPIQLGVFGVAFGVQILSVMGMGNADTPEAGPVILSVFFILQTVFRIFYIVAYKLKINKPVPVRSLMFFCAWLCTLGAACLSIASAANMNDVG